MMTGTALAQVEVAMINDGRAPDLNVFMALQRLVYPNALVSGSFYEWRTVSRYRSTAGLHLGYDIALPPGTPAVAGWPGQVTRVAQWYGAEFGITVLSPSGYEATYGHLAPRVKVGDVVNAGDSLGLVVNDHVDIKMRGPDGMYFDFGHSTPPAVGFPGGYPMPVVRPTRADAMRMYEMAWYGMHLDQEELKLARATEQRAAVELDDLRSRVRKSRADLPKMKQFLAEGLVARIEVQRAEADVRDGVARIAALRNSLRDAQRDVAGRQARVRAMQAQLEAALRVLTSMGVSKAQADRKLRSPNSAQSVAQARELQQMRKLTRDRLSNNGADKNTVAAARADAVRMQELFEQGVVSRNERDRARSRYEALRRGVQ